MSLVRLTGCMCSCTPSSIELQMRYERWGLTSSNHCGPAHNDDSRNSTLSFSFWSSGRAHSRAAAMKVINRAPPTEITLLYRNLGMTHVFIAEEFRGFHVGGATLQDALDTALHALGKHVGRLYELSTPVEYHLQGTLHDFEDQLRDADAPLNYSVTARISSSSRDAHVQ